MRTKFIGEMREFILHFVSKENADMDLDEFPIPSRADHQG